MLRDGIKPDQLAILLNVTTTTVYRLKSGECEPKFSTLIMLCAVFGEPVEGVYPDFFQKVSEEQYDIVRKKNAMGLA
jgi:DNA-binding XRE family transcriptional regulator